LPSLLFSQVEGDAFFIAIEGAKARAVTFIFRIAPPMRIAPSRQFYFDYFAAKITEETGRVGTGDVAADIDTRKSFERAGNHGSIYVGFVLSILFQGNAGVQVSKAVIAIALPARCSVPYRMTTDITCLIAIKKAFPVCKLGQLHLKCDRA
jgi:hypothetical protein